MNKHLKKEGKKTIYKAVIGDEIDAKLAVFINSQPLAQRLRLKFYREHEGVYRYHSKKVILLIEEEKLIVRVGGGYMTIEEFV